MTDLMKDKLEFDGRSRARALEECDHDALAWHAAVLEAKLAAAREVLREAWFRLSDCPCCYFADGVHDSDCKLAACLEDTDA